MRLPLLIGVLLATSLFVFAAEPAGSIKVASGVTVPVPGEGFRWKQMPGRDDGKSPKLDIYVATKEGTISNVVLLVEHATSDTDAKKLASINAVYNGMVDLLKQQGFTELKGTKPPLAPPFEKRVSFSMSGKDESGKPASFHAVIVFGKINYHVQVRAETDAEAKALAKVAEEIKE
jgi:hypothetical protein